MKRKVVLAAAILSGLAASPLSANFHFMNIVQVFGGPPAAPNAQYVMLQMWTAGQNVVGGHQLTVYNGDGSLAATLTFPPSPGGDVDNGANQATILIGTAEAQAFFGVTMDLLISPVSTTGQGLKICWAGTYDCVAIGDYTGSTTGVGLPFLMGDFSTLALTRRLDVCTGLGATPGLDQCDDTDNSATDFVLTLPSPRNNAGAVGTIPAATCGNNTLEGLEDCDDGDTESGDGCSNTCKYEPSHSSPQALVVDNNTNQSNGNGVLEPGEAVSVLPSWKNTDASALALVGGAAVFTGPAGATYTPKIGLARYGTIDPGDTHSCAATAFCYQLALSAPATRPAATHWDARFDELLSGGGRKTWMLHVGDSFTDVPRGYTFYRRIETVLHHGITTGCGGTKYCPDNKVHRDEMGLFLGRAIARGGANIPVSGTVGASAYNCVSGGVSLFSDVPPTDPACRAIHYIAAQNVAGGCGGGAFCAAQNVTRGEMALFVARGIVAPLGGGAVPLTYEDSVTHLSYSCNPASPDLKFTDITTAQPFCKHVHYLWAKGIVSGCNAAEYCFADHVSRGQMARFLSNAFAPNLYEP